MREVEPALPRSALDEGEILVLHNYRCRHGRDGHRGYLIALNPLKARYLTGTHDDLAARVGLSAGFVRAWHAGEGWTLRPRAGA
ncbi:MULTISPECIES: hypothetical protein [Nonomuraea]|uniref:TauD/TfdA-like domain-containing protein n=1 Tax=Nonomuraea salmonea TaxID=46181 RepID=A0ABV5NN27_9ACTN